MPCIVYSVFREWDNIIQTRGCTKSAWRTTFGESNNTLSLYLFSQYLCYFYAVKVTLVLTILVTSTGRFKYRHGLKLGDKSWLLIQSVITDVNIDRISLTSDPLLSVSQLPAIIFYCSIKKALRNLNLVEDVSSRLCKLRVNPLCLLMKCDAAIAKKPGKVGKASDQNISQIRRYPRLWTS